MTAHCVLDAGQSRPFGTENEVADEFVGIQLTGHGKVAFAPQFGFRAKDDLFIVRQCLRLNGGEANEAGDDQDEYS